VLRTALIVPFLAMLLFISGAQAGAQVSVRVVTPAQDSVTIGRAVTVRVRVAGPVRRFRATLHSTRAPREVARRFTQIRPGVWRGRLRVGRDLRPGVNHLFIRVRRPGGRDAVDAVHFTMATRRADLVARVRDRGSGPFRFAFRLRKGADFRAFLNGRDVRDAFASDDGRLWRGDIRPRHRMRFGANRLRVVAYDATGRYEVLGRRTVLPRTAPLGDAGEDRTVHPLSVIRLDGTASRRPGTAPLRYRWRITARPKGSRARLVGAKGPRPRLVGASPGPHQIELRVNEPRPRPGSARLAAAARDSVTLSVQQPQGPAGVPVQTIVDPANPGIQVGSTFYPGAPGFGQVLILDRATLTPTTVTNPTRLFSSDSMAQVLGVVADAITDKQMVLVAGSGMTMFGSLDPDDVQAVENALAALGGTEDQAGVDALLDGTYTLIGVPGIPAGTAIENRGGRQGTLPAGGVSGSFVTDIHANYSFMWPASFNTFDTQAPGSTDTQNRVTVAGQTFVSDQVTAEFGGWHLVWLDADTLAPRGNFTYQNCGGASPCLDGLLAQLETILGDPTPGLVVLSSVNNTRHLGVGGNETDGGITRAIGLFGGNEPAFIEPGEYTLVGLAGLGTRGPNLGLDVNQAVARSPSSRIVGVLRRNQQGLWQGGTSGTPGPTQDVTVWQPGLQQILAQPAQPFPSFSAPGPKAAFAYIAKNVPLTVSTPAALRAQYWNDDNIVWSDLYTSLRALAPCRTSPCAGSFASVKQTLLAEWEDLTTVKSYFTGGGSTQLDGIYQSAFTDSTLGFEAIAAGIMSDYPSPPAQPARAAEWLTLLDSSLTLARGLTGFVPVVGGPVTAALSVGQGAEDIYRAVANTQGGAQALDPRVFEGDIFTFGKDLENAWTAQVASLSHVSDLLVSDAGRLSAAAARIDDATGTDGWGLDTDSAGKITETLQASIAGYVWTSMLPVSTQVFTCSIYDRLPGTPALDQATLSYYMSEQAGDQGGPPYQVASSWAYLASRGHPKDFPSSTVLDQIFGTDEGELALQHPYLMAWAARKASGDPNGAIPEAGAPGFEWVSEDRDASVCQSGGP
jgi:hypothetical protein